MEGVGLTRRGGFRAFTAKIREEMGSIACGRVYTFSFWCLARFFDVAQWEVVMPLMSRVSAEGLFYAPLYLVLYELDESQMTATDRRHLTSRKRYAAKAALWSTARPPAARFMQEIDGAPAELAAARTATSVGKHGSMLCCWGR